MVIAIAGRAPLGVYGYIRTLEGVRPLLIISKSPWLESPAVPPTNHSLWPPTLHNTAALAEDGVVSNVMGSPTVP